MFDVLIYARDLKRAEEVAEGRGQVNEIEPGKYGLILDEKVKPATKVNWGPPLWDALFKEALILETIEERQALLAKVESAIPPTCNCLAHWKFYKKAHPIDFSSKESFFESLVSGKNSVRLRQNKPTMSVTEVLKLYA